MFGLVSRCGRARDAHVPGRADRCRAKLCGGWGAGVGGADDRGGNVEAGEAIGSPDVGQKDGGARIRQGQVAGDGVQAREDVLLVVETHRARVVPVDGLGRLDGNGQTDEQEEQRCHHCTRLGGERERWPREHSWPILIHGTRGAGKPRVDHEMGVQVPWSRVSYFTIGYRRRSQPS